MLGLAGGQGEGLVEAERRAFGVGPLELFLAEGGGHRVEAVPAVVRFGFWPWFSRAVKEGLRGAVKLCGPARVAQVRGDTCQAQAGVGEIE